MAGSNRGTARSHHAATRQGPWGYIVAAVVVVGLAVAFYPRAALAASGQALARVSTTSLATSLTHIRISWPGGSVRGTTKSGRVWPMGTVPADRTVTVTADVTAPGFLAWLPGFQTNAQWTVTTPAAPKPVSHQLIRELGATTVVKLSSPAARWRVKTNSGWQPWRTGPVVLSDSRVKPDQKGTVVLEAAGRSWESATNTMAIAWVTPPYLSAEEVNASTITSTGQLIVEFSQPVVNPDPSQWTVSPNVAGHWQALSATKYEFTPSGAGFPPGSNITVTVPGGPTGVHTQSGTYLAKTWKGTTTVAPGSVTRLQQWLAALGYLPVTWTAQTGTTVDVNSPTIWQAAPGTFSWRWSNLPSPLTALWQPGVFNAMTQGALMQFQRVAGLTVNGEATGQVWTALEHAWLNKQMSPDGYSYILVSEDTPETLQLWLNGQLYLTSDANTGISLTPTTLGTFPIYERLPFQVMQGVNPNGTPYADPVHWINYFDGGEAVHGFPRASYGFPQSLGCVELPLNVAPIVYSHVHYGTLVTVLPAGAPT